MSLTLKILLAADAFFALLLIVYLAVKYGKMFSKRPEYFKSENKEGVEVEVAYVDEPLAVKTEEVVATQLNEQKEAEIEETKIEESSKEEEEVDESPLPEKEKENIEEERKQKEEVALTIGSFEELETLVSSEKE